MRWALAAVLAFAFHAVADDAQKSPAKAETKTEKPTAADDAKRSPAKAETKTEKPTVADDAKQSPEKAEAKPKCKKRAVGKGKDRKVTCVYEQAIVITSGPPKPAVVIAPVDGRKVTGRPKLTDPLKGLPRRRE